MKPVIGETYSNVWGKEKYPGLRVPDEAILICCHWVTIRALVDVDEYLYLHKTDTHDELWCVSEIEPVLGQAKDPERIRNTEALLLLAIPRDEEVNPEIYFVNELLRARWGYVYPNQVVLEGLIGSNRYDEIMESISRDIKQNQTLSNGEKSKIIKMAIQLGLNPVPPTIKPHIWQATCPGTNHRLLLNEKTEEFGCGYCRKKGDHIALKDLIELRGGAMLLK